MHWLRYLPEEMSLRRHQHHQLAYEPRYPGHPSLQRQQLQAAQAAYAETGTGAWVGRDERYWKKYGVEDIGREIEAEPGTI